LLMMLSRGNALGIGLSVAGMAVVWILATIFFAVVTLPFNLRAMLLGSIPAAFDIRWSWDFIKRMAGPTIIASFVMSLIAFPIAVAGLLACYVGLFFSISIITLMRYHVQVQLYQLYLDRGGTPLPISDDPVSPAFPVVQPAPPPIVRQQ
jgi:hypothetical protein